MKRFFTRKYISIICLVVFVFCALYLPHVLQYFRSGPDTRYQFAAGFIPDYYQYLSWIKSGSLGDFLLTTRYSGIAHPKVLVHPLFSITGQITGRLHITPPYAFLLLQIIATAVFLYMLYLFIRTLYPSGFSRNLAICFFLFGTGLYTIAKEAGVWQVVDPISWSGHFNIISKYSIPPHHLLALAAWMGLVILFTRSLLALRQAQGKLKGETFRNLLPSIILGWCIALLNPSIFLFGLIFLISGFVLSVLYPSKLQALSSKLLLKRLLIFLLCVSPVLLYNIFILRLVPPWSIMYQRTLAFNPDTSFINYLFSLGPLLPLSLIGIWIIRKRLTLIHFIMASWAYLPILLFPLVGSVLPINYSRLFQSYQYLPITLLAVSGIVGFIRPPLALRQAQGKLHGVALRKFIGVLLICLIILYGAIAYVVTIIPTLAPHGLSYYNVFVPKSLLAAFERLDTVPGERVILSGEYTSHMIPAFTRHRALIGRDDSVLDYYPLQDKAFAFLDGRMTEPEALDFVQEQKINFVIFGVDTKPLSELPTNNYRFLSPLFTDGSVTIVKTDLLFKLR